MPVGRDAVIMQFTAEHYFRVSRERIGQAWALYRLGSAYALAMYSAGVAVECMLRAYKLRIDATFDERHDLARLLRSSGIFNLERSLMRRKGLSQEQIRVFVREIQNAVNDVVILWSNDYRFASEQRLRVFLRKTVSLKMRVTGDLLKPLALRLLNAAERVVNRGEVLWERY